EDLEPPRLALPGHHVPPRNHETERLHCNAQEPAGQTSAHALTVSGRMLRDGLDDGSETLPVQGRGRAASPVARGRGTSRHLPSPRGERRWAVSTSYAMARATVV